MNPARICRRQRLTLFTAASLLAVAWLGCASGPATSDHFYRIEIAAPTRLASPRLAGTLEVDRLRVEAISQGRRMLYREAGEPVEIAQHAYHYWVDPPNVMIQEQLVRYLRAVGVARQVVTPAVHVKSGYLVSGRLAQLERVLSLGEQRIVVEIEFVLTQGSGRKLLLLQSYREERVVPGNDVRGSVTAYEQAITAIFNRFVADIPSS